MRNTSRTSPVRTSTCRKPKTSATHRSLPSIFRPAGTATLPLVSVRSSPVAGLKACTSLLAMFET
ncbi:hypothetical protein D9M68_368580 [compost metagenome]